MTKITELESRLNKTEDILNQIKANQETLTQTLITQHETLNGIKDSVVELSKRE